MFNDSPDLDIATNWDLGSFGWFRPDTMSFINKCHGKHHKVFLIDTSTLNIAKRNFCVREDYNTNGFWNEIVALIRRKFFFANTIIEIIMRLNIA